MLFLLVFMIFFVSGTNQTENENQVEVEEGILQGFSMKSLKGRKFSAFLGVPYAEPPIGELRFKSPRPAKPWSGIRYATEYPSICSQINPFGDNHHHGVEDCLYANIFTPNISSELKAVMFWIHGGGWNWGAGATDPYQPHFLMDREIVLVTFNYRLGPLGFITTGDAECPGNNGMKDMVQLLKWVKKNIQKFGGDPDNITVFGQSAGGSSAHMLMVSPSSRDMVHKVIAQSGTAHALWALADQKNFVEEISLLTKCPKSPSSSFLNCLRNKDYVEITMLLTKFWNWDINPLLMFAPVIEPDGVSDAFLPDDVTALIKKQTNKKPFMTGITSNEGALYAPRYFYNQTLIKMLNDDVNGKLKYLIYLIKTSSTPEETGKKIWDYYFKNENFTVENLNDSFSDMIADALFLNSLDYSILLHLEHSSASTYVYDFSFRGTASYSRDWGDPDITHNYGVSHCDELFYLFNHKNSYPEIKWTEEEQNMREIMLDLWTSFAKTGKPSNSQNVAWTPIEKNKEYSIMDITTNLKIIKGVFEERIKFWRNLNVRDKFPKPKSITN